MFFLNPNPPLILFIKCCFQEIIERIEQFVFYPWKYPKISNNTDTYHRMMLAVGSISKKLAKADRKEEALALMKKVHNMVGIHGKMSIHWYH